jgi:hypothetical protein
MLGEPVSIRFLRPFQFRLPLASLSVSRLLLRPFQFRLPLASPSLPISCSACFHGFGNRDIKREREIEREIERERPLGI